MRRIRSNQEASSFKKRARQSGKRKSNFSPVNQYIMVCSVFFLLDFLYAVP